MRAFVDECNSPWVGACLDVDAVQRGGGFPQDWIRSLGHRVMQVRLNDTAARSLGASRITGSLAEMRYRGPATCSTSCGDLKQARLQIERLVAPTSP